MSRVRIEIWDNEDNVRSAEVEHSDSRTAFDRARRMAEATLPDEEKGPTLKPSSYTFEMKNVQVTDITKQLLFVDAEGRKQAATGFDVKVVGGGGYGRCPKAAPGRGRGNRCVKDEGHSGQHVGEVDGWRWSDPDPTPTSAGEARKPCGEKCQDADGGSCTDPCARPAGHDDWHVTSDRACTWAPEATPPCHLVCTVDDNCWAECAKAKGHEGEHRCKKVHRSEMPKSQCAMYCDKSNPDCYDRCTRSNHHDGDCYCVPAHNESLCLNEIGAPSATRNCHQELGHEGHCDGMED